MTKLEIQEAKRINQQASQMNELKEKFPNASECFIRLNPDFFIGSVGAKKDAESKCAVRDESLGQAPREAENTGRFLVSIVSYRKKLLDPDNLCPKYFIDCLRYAGLIPDDRPQDIELKVSQIQTRGEEGVAVRIERI